MYVKTAKHVMTANMRAQNTVKMKIKTQAVLESSVIYDMSLVEVKDVTVISDNTAQQKWQILKHFCSLEDILYLKILLKIVGYEIIYNFLLYVHE